MKVKSIKNEEILMTMAKIMISLERKNHIIYIPKTQYKKQTNKQTNKQTHKTNKQTNKSCMCISLQKRRGLYNTYLELLSEKWIVKRS